MWTDILNKVRKQKSKKHVDLDEEKILNKNDLRVQISMYKDNPKFFIDLHSELLMIFNRRNEYQLKEPYDFKYEPHYEQNIRTKLGETICRKLEDLKDDFFDKLITKLDLAIFTQDITERNYYSSLESYATEKLESIYALYKRMFHRLSITKVSHDSTNQELINQYNERKMISYHHLFYEPGEEYFNTNLIDFYNVYINSIVFTNGYIVDEMKYFTELTLHRKEKLFELLKNEKNKISLKRRKNLCESEISSIRLWKKLMKEEYPKCLAPIEELVKEELFKINTSFKKRDEKEIFFSLGHEKYRKIPTSEMKKFYKQLVVVYIDCSFDHFCKVIFNGDGQIDWKGNKNELLYFASLLKKVGIVKDYCVFLYRHFTILGKEIIEDNTYKAQVYKIKNEIVKLKRKKNIEKAFFYISDI